MTKPFVDPEFERWNRKYPRFPGVTKCLELLGASNVHGAWTEIICHELELYAKQSTDNAEEFVAAVIAEKNLGVQCVALGVLAECRIPQALPAFVEMLQSTDADVRNWALRGLQNLNTKEARRALWNAGIEQTGT